MEANAQLNEKKVYHDVNLRIIFAVTLMAVLGVSSISPAFVKISQEFNIHEEIGLLITFFTLPGVFLTPVMGVLADRFGRKRILVPSLMLFGIAGTACAFAPKFEILLLLRFFQGIGAASLGSLNATLIGDIYSGRQRTEAMGYNASVLSIGTASYPALGGFIAVFGWNYPFLLPILAIPIGLLVLYKLNAPEPKNTQNLLAYLGNALKSMNDRRVFVLFTAGVITFILFYGAILTYFPFIIVEFLGPGEQVNPEVVIGSIMAALSLATAVTSFQLGNLIRLFSEKRLLKAAFFLFTVALFLVPFVPDLLVLLVPAVIFGIAQGINFPSNQSLLVTIAPMEYRAAFMSINGMVLRLGQTLGPLVMGFVFTLGGINGVFITAAVLGLFMFLLLTIFLK
ncbi:MAG: MFS transporter [Peptococcaceae bacterium]